MRRKYRVRYKLPDGYYGNVETSGEDLNPRQARLRVEDYLEANGIPYVGIDDVCEVISEKTITVRQGD